MYEGMKDGRVDEDDKKEEEMEAEAEEVRRTTATFWM